MEINGANFVDIFDEFTKSDLSVDSAAKSLEELRKDMNVKEDLVKTLLPLIGDCWFENKERIVEFVKNEIKVQG